MLGRGDKVAFWKDNWSHTILAEGFERLYNLFKNKNISVRDMHEQWNIIKINEQGHWRRELRGWEIENLQILGQIIEYTRLSNMEDKLIWKINGGVYTTAQGYEILQGQGINDIHWLLLSLQQNRS